MFLIYGNDIEKNIMALGDIIKSLNPVEIDFSKKYGMLNLFNPIKKYFNNVKKEEISIGKIIDFLNNEKNILNRDNITLEIEINRINEIIEQLQNEYNSGNILKKNLENLIEHSQNNQDEVNVKFYTQNFLIPLDKKMFDIKQMIIVKQQSIMALHIIIRNNKEIMRNIDRVNNITISALNTAVLVAKTLYHQKLVLNIINNVENGVGKINTDIGTKFSNELNLNKIDSETKGKLLLKTAFDNAIEVFNDVDRENKRTFPENEKKIMELKIGE